MATFYFSGIDRATHIALLAAEGASGMVNANCATQPVVLRGCGEYPQVKLALDSGAFQGRQDVGGYAAMIERVGERYEWYANLDVIGNQAASNANYERLTSLLPAPHASKVLWVYQGGANGLEELERAAYQKRHVGVGGLVPIISRDAGEALDLIGNVGRVLARAGARAHFFGVGSCRIISAYHPESWFDSVDSSTWQQGAKSLKLILADGRQKKAAALGLCLNRAECTAQNVRQMLSWVNAPAPAPASPAPLPVTKAPAPAPLRPSRPIQASLWDFESEALAV